MKNILLVPFIILAFGLQATMQEPDILILDDSEYNISLNKYWYNSPLESYIKQVYSTSPFEADACSTDNYRGFVGFWKFVDDKLYLSQIKIRGVNLPLLKMFETGLTEHGLFADWFNGLVYIRDKETYAINSCMEFRGGELLNTYKLTFAEYMNLHSKEPSISDNIEEVKNLIKKYETFDSIAKAKFSSPSHHIFLKITLDSIHSKLDNISIDNEIESNISGLKLIEELPDFASVKDKIEINEVLFGSSAVAVNSSNSLLIKFNFLSNSNLTSVSWENPIKDDKLEYNWTQINEYISNLDQTLNNFSDIVNWKKSKHYHQIQLLVIGLEWEKTIWDNPPWQKAKLNNKPEYKIILRDSKKYLGSVYISESWDNSLILSIDKDIKLSNLDIFGNMNIVQKLVDEFQAEYYILQVKD